MKLKRIELYGFKSFAQSTELELAEGITAIVGPNGSGKSNIADAVRWVLGEQSARSLRGARMEDVIFAGSDDRRALNYCEVSLTLDNEDAALGLDFSEVTITRRLYRSGESQFFINRQLCRMKDIHDLFADTGLGRDAFSIVGQGKIDEVLNARPEERRGIFEEAAGIVRYRNRKREAEKHLEETRDNLTRIGDIILELEQQLVPLQEKAEKARHYFSLQKELSQVELGLYVHRIREMKAQWQKAQEKVLSISDEMLRRESGMAALEAQLAQQRQELGRLEEQSEELQNSHWTVREELERTRAARQVLQERQQHLRQLEETGRQKEQEIQQNLSLWEERYREAEQTYNQAEEALRQAEENHQRLAHEWEQRSQELTRDRQLMEQRKNLYFDQLNQLVQMRNSLQHARQQLRNQEQQLQRAESEAARLRERHGQLQATARQLSAEDEELQARADRELAKKARLQQLQEEKSRDIQQLRQQLTQEEQQLQQMRSRHQLLVEMQQEFEGFAQGVRAILKARNQGIIKGIHGAVAELIQVPPRYEVAVETALGAALQQVVVDSEACGRQCIGYLKEKRLGRATFLPLDVIRPRRIPSHLSRSLSEMRGFVGTAATLVSTAPAYEHILSFLLGQVLVVESLEQASLVARRTGYRYRVVTLEGDVVHPGGSMTGGAGGRGRSLLLSRQREEKELHKKIREREEQLRSRYQQLEQLQQEQDRLAQELQQIEQQVQALEQQRLALRGDRERNQAETKAMEERLRWHQEMAEQLLREVEEWRQKEQQWQKQLEATSPAVEQMRHRLQEQDDLEQQRQKQLEELQQVLTEARLEVDRLKQRLFYTEERMQEALKQRQICQDQWQSALQEKQRLKQEWTQAGAELQEAAQRQGALEEQALELEGRLQALRVEKRQKEQQLLELEEQLRLRRREYRLVEEQLREAEVKVGRCDMALQHLLSSLSQEYEMSFERAQSLASPPADVSEAERQAERLKRRMKELGEVHLGAIEELEQLEQRYTFLQEQRQDLEEARNRLLDVIAEMDAQISKRFLSSFASIRTHFQKVFESLFGGGKADLVLTDRDNPLSTGIEILVKPPGKKMQNLSLLSGGERALTAIALLFAIFSYRPVPFCLLDEVDAALDEANVQRFARYLRRFSQQMQCIVVTHRKATMEEADYLYGVTMEDSGVSSLVSVRLEDVDEVAVSQS